MSVVDLTTCIVFLTFFTCQLKRKNIIVPSSLAVTIDWQLLLNHAVICVLDQHRHYLRHRYHEPHSGDWAFPAAAALPGMLCQNVFIHCIRATSKNSGVQGICWWCSDIIVPLVTTDAWYVTYPCGSSWFTVSLSGSYMTILNITDVVIIVGKYVCNVQQRPVLNWAHHIYLIFNHSLPADWSQLWSSSLPFIPR